MYTIEQHTQAMEKGILGTHDCVCMHIFYDLLYYIGRVGLKNFNIFPPAFLVLLARLIIKLTVTDSQGKIKF